ncbi:MAG: hypothetical protein HRT76_15320, partial [Halieaceae bacterium]|nr:hypothetical protein [Halieaceae bacterium]
MSRAQHRAVSFVSGIVILLVCIIARAEETDPDYLNSKHIDPYYVALPESLASLPACTPGASTLSRDLQKLIESGSETDLAVAVAFGNTEIKSRPDALREHYIPDYPCISGPLPELSAANVLETFINRYPGSSMAWSLLGSFCNLDYDTYEECRISSANQVKSNQKHTQGKEPISYGCRLNTHPKLRRDLCAQNPAIQW